jgi:hypothetical protein
MKTEVTNVLTQDKDIYVNDLTPEENIVNTIIKLTNQSSNLLNENVRNRIKELNKIETFYSSVDNKTVAFCENFNLYARPVS